MTAEAPLPQNTRNHQNPTAIVNSTNAVGFFFILVGLIGIIASVTLTVENIHLLADPTYIPSCNLNPVLACGSLMSTPQAAILGFPNSLIGIIGFTVVLTTGVLTLTQAVIPYWYWLALLVGILCAVIFIHWLIFESLYAIGSLCPYCMVVWTITIPLLTVLLGIVILPYRHHTFLNILYQWRWTLTAVWFIALGVLIFIRFENYWITIL